MKITNVAALLVLYTGLLHSIHPKLLNYLKDIDESLIKVIYEPQGSAKQKTHLERAKAIVNQAIQTDGIIDNAKLYSIAAYLFDDPVYAARAIELEKNKTAVRSTTIQLERKVERMDTEAEKYRNHIIDRIAEEEFLLMTNEEDSEEAKANTRRNLTELKKTLAWIEAQSITHGMLKESLFMYKNNREQQSHGGSSSGV